MTRTILVAGTASHVGKSTVVAGLCRLFARRGVSVAPFKAQNMSNNARAVVKPDGSRGSADGGRSDSDGDWGDSDGGRSDWGEIGVSQYVQSRAAEIAATTDLNPVLLKPRGDGESQLVVQGEAVGHFSAGSFYDDHWETAREAAAESYERLAADHEVVVAEGAGSIAELNLLDRDLANVETARIASETRRKDRATESRGVDILLVADIERGGVFASVYGTLELMPEDLRERVGGVVINKFRGDRAVLEPGIEELEARTGVPVVGVLPFDDPGLPAEDSVSLPATRESSVRGADDGVADADAVTVAVPRLPRISNFTDLEPLAREPGVRVAYRPLDADFGDADAVVLPGTKNAVDDLLALRDAGFGDELDSVAGPAVGLCGGYQLLGERITNASVEGTGDREVVDGFGLLPVETRFSPDKRVERVERELAGVGPLAGATGTVSGYEIHMGETTPTGPVARPFEGEGAATDRALGTYLHGLFENEIARDAFVEAVFESAGRSRPATESDARNPYDAAADLLEANAPDLLTRFDL